MIEGPAATVQSPLPVLVRWTPATSSVDEFSCRLKSLCAPPCCLLMVLRWYFDNIGEGNDTEEIALTNDEQELLLGAIQSKIWRGWLAICFAF